MTRPAIVIGLGGTGQWVLTFLKKELLEIGGGTIPPSVKLLSFDTIMRTTAEIEQSSKRDKDEDIQAGTVSLIKGKEFIPLGDNIGALASEIAAGKHSHLQWFPAKSFLSKLPPAAFDTKEGSGQIRQMGRISLFRDLAAFQRSEILSHLRAAMQDLQGEVSQDKQLEIIIVGSLAGGTGAGMLVDLAYQVRSQAAKMVENNYVVRGFFVLPRTFSAGGPGEGRDMLARSFAAWRELDRFMIVSERFGLRHINYHETNQDLQIPLDRRAYDISYMIDPAQSAVNSLDNVRVEEGLFPGLAHVISAILDEKAGKEYTEFITTNLAGKLAHLPRRPYHSTIGSYTLKVPVYYAQEKFSHQLALDVLREFVAPEIDDKGRVIGVSEIRNREVPEGQDGVQSALKFMLASAINISGRELPNTKFLPLLAEVRGKDGLRNSAIVQQIACGGLTVGNSRYLSGLTDISQDDEGKLIMRDIADELNYSIWRDVAPSRIAGDTPDSAYSRIKNRVPQVRQEHYGVDTASGERLRGKYGKALEQAKNAQVARFRSLLQAWTLHALNGDSTDAHVARGGKIGYVRSFYAGLIDNFDYFVKFLNTVHQTRNEELRLPFRTRQAADSAFREYERLRDKKSWLTFWDDFVHPDAHRAQRNYLLAEQRDIDVRKDDILLDVLAEATLVMRAIAEKSLSDIQNWITHLATGDQNLKINGLYPEAIDSLGNVNHQIDKRLDKISQLVGEHEYKTDEKHVIESLDRLKWQVSDVSDGLKITCGIEFPADERNQSPTYSPFRREGKNPSKANLELILKLAQRPFKTLYDEFESEMKRLSTNIKDASLTLVDSEDSHKLTIIRSNDLIASADFQIWHDCRDAYIQQVTDLHRDIPAAELHVFPAEINACSYESEIPRLTGENYRLLHPEVVALLEDKERFEMFLRAYALGFIKVNEEKGAAYWAYKLPTDKETLYLSEPSKSLYGNVKEDIFQVIHNFVADGVDQRPGMNQQRYVNWEELRNVILNTQRDMGSVEVIKLYRQQIDDSKGISEMILSEVARERTAIGDQALQEAFGHEYEDLAILSKYIFMKSIQVLEQKSED